jgi:glycosyltransferase involved in cell wall biosynthesis
MKKKKILMLSDHALSTSGVGTQSRHLINGLLKKYPGEWSFRQFGGAIKHEDYSVKVVNPDFIIKPTNGFGNPDMIRQTLATEKPDLLLIFTDPRFFDWLFQIEDEVHQMCPIAWWHVWDNHPYPEFNSSYYQSTDLINCHSHLTYEMVKEQFPNKTNFVPHALPDDLFFKLNENQIKHAKVKVLGEKKKENFVLFWMNRNARRKRPADLLLAWKLFMDKIKKEGKSDASLILHTDPRDHEGPNLLAITDKLEIKDSVVFSTERIDFDKINILHNIADCTINISYAEGFGLATLESMQAGTPIIAAKTGGLTRQVVNHRDGSENGVALDISFKSLVGSQQVPYIFEDYCTVENTAEAIYKMYSLSEKERRDLSQKCLDYVKSDFSYDNTIDLWHNTMKETIQNWKSRYQRWSLEEV